MYSPSRSAVDEPHALSDASVARLVDELRVDRVLVRFASAQWRSRLPVASADGIRNRCPADPCPVSPLPRKVAGGDDDMHLDAVGHRVEPQDRIGLPVAAGILPMSKVTASYNVHSSIASIAPSIWLISPSDDH